MPEISDEQKSEPLDLQRYLGVARRRYPHFLIGLFVGWLVVWGASWILPARYKSTTLILVEQPTMPKDYVTPNVNEDLQSRLQNITQQILSRTRLLRIADQMKLYAAGPNVLTPDETVARMRKDIEIVLVRDSQETITAFNISYSASDPRVAQRVTGELTKLFIDENLEVRQHQSEDTTKFLEDQLETARQSLSEQEAKVRAVQRSTHRRLAQPAGEQSPDLERDAVAAADRRRRAEYGATAASLLAVADQSISNSPGELRGLSTAPRLGCRRSTSNSKNSKYNWRTLALTIPMQHPDIRKLKVQIAETEKMRDRLMAKLKSKANAEPARWGFRCA